MGKTTVAERARQNGRKGGRPKGSQNKRVVARELRRHEEVEVLRELFRAEMGAMFKAQIEHAKGISHFFLRNTAGQWERVTDPDEIAAALNTGEGFWIYTKDPSAQSFRDIADRVMGKAAENVDHKHTHLHLVAERLATSYKRLEQPQQQPVIEAKSS